MEPILSPVDRRTFLQLLLGSSVAAVVASSWPASLLGQLPPLPASEGTAAGLLRVFDDMESATAIGQAYLADYPQWVSMERLADDILGRLTAVNPDWHRLSVNELRSALRAQIRRDFAAERTVKLQGWLVSLTEAQLCGLSALSQPL